MDTKSAISLSKLIAEAADTIEVLLEASDGERALIDGAAKDVMARLRALDGHLSDEIFAAAMKSRQP